jgi:hypothetical protein
MFRMSRSVYNAVFSAIAAVAVAALIGVPAGASVARSLALDELARESDAIVVARCLAVASRWNDAHTQIITEAVYAPSSVEKGRIHRRFSVVALGGVADGLGMYVVGMPTFAEGREEVLFLSAGSAGEWRCVGMAQGQFIVATTSAGERRVVGRDLNGLELAGDVDARLAPQPLAAFVGNIRRTAR